MSEPSFSSKPSMSRCIIFRLARADLAHEWVLTLCLVMAIAAALAPLLIVFGLKYGTIETLRNRLMRDPRNREIRPMLSKSFTHDWFETIKNRPDVAFVVPTTRQISATLEASIPNDKSAGKTHRVQLDITPTADGDPLLLENGAHPPDPAQCVLTHAAAEALGAKIGSILSGSVKRFKDGRFETGELRLTVSGILHPRATTLKAMYVRIQVLDAVERYKDGQAIPEYGWPGAIPTAYPQYDGLALVLPRALNAIEEYQLINGTGFLDIQRLSGDDLSRQWGLRVDGNGLIYVLAAGRRSIGQESIEAVRNRLHGLSAALMPLVNELEADLLESSGRKLTTLRLKGLAAPTEVGHLQVHPLPPWKDPGIADPECRQIMLPAGIVTPGVSVALQLKRGEESLVFPVDIVSWVAPGQEAFVPSQLAGVLNLFKERNIAFDPNVQQFVLSRRGYAGFRLYAAGIDDVELLRRYFEAMELPVHTEAERVLEVTRLDTHLSLIFWLIAGVVVTGGTTALMASLYASVQRKQKEISVIRLLGFSAAMVLRFPIYQGLLITVGGFLVALAFFEAMAVLINVLFRAHLQTGESFCLLSIRHLAIALLTTVAVAVVASSAAAWQANRIDPAESLRDE